nr:syntaxin-61 [Fagopyrum tataricum]
MSSAKDPFYIVKEEIQDSIDELLSSFNEWQGISSDTGKKVQLRRTLITGCESIRWQVDELDKAISVAAKDPAFYGIDKAELERRRAWTKSAHDKVGTVMMTVGKGLGYQDASNVNGTHRELMRYPLDNSRQKASSSDYAHDNDDFMSSGSDRQLLLMKQQDEELDELSASVQRIGHVGLTIHNELIEQERIMDDLGGEIDSTSNRLEFLQKKVAFIMKKAGVKGQCMLMLFLLALFIILFVLVFLT